MIHRRLAVSSTVISTADWEIRFIGSAAVARCSDVCVERLENRYVNTNNLFVLIPVVIVNTEGLDCKATGEFICGHQPRNTSSFRTHARAGWSNEAAYPRMRKCVIARQ